MPALERRRGPARARDHRGLSRRAARLRLRARASGSTRATRSRSRATSSLSYFDHPPLHQWIAHFAALALGEGFGARLPFIALFAATGWLFYRLTLRSVRRAGGARRAVRAQRRALLLRLRRNAGSCPTGRCCSGSRSPRWRSRGSSSTPTRATAAVWRLWLAAGFGFGLAGLSKYSAALSVVGLLALSSRSRRASAAGSPPGALCRGRARARDDRARSSSGMRGTAGCRSPFRARAARARAA